LKRYKVVTRHLRESVSARLEKPCQLTRVVPHDKKPVKTLNVTRTLPGVLQHETATFSTSFPNVAAPGTARAMKGLSTRAVLSFPQVCWTFRTKVFWLEPCNQKAVLETRFCKNHTPVTRGVRQCFCQTKLVLSKRG
jgi:hypothetical protein